MPESLVDLLQFDSNDHEQRENLRMALMFKEEVDLAVHGFMELLQVNIEASDRSPEQITSLIEETVRSTYLSGMRAYRAWLIEQGSEPQRVEERSGRDIPSSMFQPHGKNLHQ